MELDGELERVLDQGKQVADRFEQRQRLLVWLGQLFKEVLQVAEVLREQDEVLQVRIGGQLLLARLILEDGPPPDGLCYLLVNRIHEQFADHLLLSSILRDVQLMVLGFASVERFDNRLLSILPA